VPAKRAGGLTIPCGLSINRVYDSDYVYVYVDGRKENLYILTRIMTHLLETTTRALSWACGKACHPWFLTAIIAGTGLYLTLRLLFPQARFFARAWALAFGRRRDEGETPAEGETSPAGALLVSIAMTTGAGYVAGTATAIHLGGPGALFWVWACALPGMALKLAEVSLALRYRGKEADGAFTGGPMQTIRAGLSKRWRFLAPLFALLCALAALLGTGNSFQSHMVAGQLHDAAGIPAWAAGAAFALLAAPLVFAGLGRGSRVVAPLAAGAVLVYCAAALAVVATSAGALPGALALVVSNAFSGTAATGGIVGIGVAEMLRQGLGFAMLSSQTGVGTTAVVHAAARSRTPLGQGAVAMLEHFVPAILVATLTALAILSTGAWHEKRKGTVEASRVRIYKEEVATAEEALDEGKLLSALLKFEKGVLEGGVYFFHERSIIESAILRLDGKPFSGALQVGKGRIVGGTILQEGKARGIGGRDMPFHEQVTKRQLEAVTITGYLVPPGEALAGAAFSSRLGPAGAPLLLALIVLLGLLSCVAWCWCGERAARFLLGARAVVPFRVAYLGLTLLGGVAALDAAWAIAGIAAALMAVVNLLSVWLLAGVAAGVAKGDVGWAEEDEGGKRRKKR